MRTPTFWYFLFVITTKQALKILGQIANQLLSREIPPMRESLQHCGLTFRESKFLILPATIVGRLSQQMPNLTSPPSVTLLFKTAYHKGGYSIINIPQ